MSYLDTGFDTNLQRDLFPQPTQLSSIDYDAVVQSISAEKILPSGTIASADGRTNLDLPGGVFTASDGNQERVRMGRMDDGQYGLRIKDKDGNIIVDITGTTNLLQSADKNMQIDFTANQMRFYDEQTLRIIIGKGII